MAGVQFRGPLLNAYGTGNPRKVINECFFRMAQECFSGGLHVQHRDSVLHMQATRETFLGSKISPVPVHDVSGSKKNDPVPVRTGLH